MMFVQIRVAVANKTASQPVLPVVDKANALVARIRACKGYRLRDWQDDALRSAKHLISTASGMALEHNKNQLLKEAEEKIQQVECELPL